MRKVNECPLCKTNIVSQLRKYCQKCKRNYVTFSARNIDRFTIEFYDICIFCRDEVRMLETLSQGEMSHQLA